MIDKVRASRNRTITLTDDDRERLLKTVQCTVPVNAIPFVIEGIRLGNYQDWVQCLPLACIDLLFLDPPYNLDKVFNSTKFSRSSVETYTRWLDGVVKSLKPLLKSTATVYICGDWFTSASIFQVASEHFIIRNRITWEREKGRGAQSNWKNASEDIWFCTLSDAYKFNVDQVKLRRKVMAPYTNVNGTPKDWVQDSSGNFRDTYPSNLWTDITIPFWSMPENTDHPAQKSEKLLAKLILASSDAGDFIFDPFLGSGTSVSVAHKLNRRFFGTEIDEYYCLLAAKRLELAAADKEIQGYTNGVFWERNTLATQKSLKEIPEVEIMQETHDSLVSFLVNYSMTHPGCSKETLAQAAQIQFKLVKERSVYYTPSLAIRFAIASGKSFSNVVLSLSALQKYDNRPFIVCVVRPENIEFLLANTTFLKKISHSSHKLNIDNIRGSFLGTDIIRTYDGIENKPENFASLFELHLQHSWQENIERLEKQTNAIVPTGVWFQPTLEQQQTVISAPTIAAMLSASPEYLQIGEVLTQNVHANIDAILRAGKINNVNQRGNSIEQIVTHSNNFHSVEDLSRTLQLGTEVKIDIKTKILTLSSNPKAYNIDKVLRALAKGNTVVSFFFIGINLETEQVTTCFVSIFDKTILNATHIQFHWAGRNSRGVTQLSDISPIFEPDFIENIDVSQAEKFLQRLLNILPKVKIN